MNIIIQNISKEHLKSAHKIYNYYISYSYANFEEKKISFKNFYLNYKNIINNRLPFLVAIIGEKVVGITYLNKFREKSGYRFVYENTIYIHHEYLKKGVGSKLLKELIILSKNNKKIKKIVAVISGIDSKGSINLHLKLGFKTSGTLKRIGFKNGKWIDCILMQITV